MTVAGSNAENVTLTQLLSDGLFIDGDWVESKDQDPNGEVRLIQLADIGDGVFRNRSARFLTQSKAKELRCTFLQEGDILVARMPEPLGRACLFPGVGQPAVTVVDVCVVRPNPRRVRPEWLVTAINSPQFRDSMQQFVRGTTRQRISRRNLGTLPLRVPEIDEQLATAQAVERLERKRGDASSHLDSGRRAIGRFRHAVLAAACSGRLTADWRDTRGLGQWQSERAEDACRKVQSGTTPKVWHTEDGGIPFLKVYNIVDQRLNFDYRPQYISPELFRGAYKRTEALPGDVLMNIVGPPLGKVAVVTEQYPAWSINQAITLFRPSERLSTEWLYMFLCSGISVDEVINDTKGSVGQVNISLTQCRNFMIPVPTWEEQMEINRRVGELLKLANPVAERISAASMRVDRSSQALLAKAFRGELTR